MGYSPASADYQVQGLDQAQDLDVAGILYPPVSLQEQIKNPTQYIWETTSQQH